MYVCVYISIYMYKCFLTIVARSHDTEILVLVTAQRGVEGGG